MDLITVEFAILLIKVTISFMPGIAGIYCIAATEESKRELRKKGVLKFIWCQQCH